MVFGNVEAIKAHYEAVFKSEEYAQRFHPGVDDPKRRKRRPLFPGALPDIVEAARRLNVTEEKIRTFVRAGALRFINVGHGTKRPRYRFTDADLQDFIDSRKQQDIPQCQFSKPQSPRRISGTTSSSTVIGFTALRAARLARKPRK